MHEATMPTVLSGRAFTAAEIALVRETVGDCAGLPWSEVVQTICEHLDWVTPTGRNKFASCAKALATLERAGLLTLPVKQIGLGGRQRFVIGADTDAEAAVTGTVRDIAPVEVTPVTATAEMRQWNAYVERYHSLGFRRPFAAHQRYFVVGAGERRLGCLLFAASAWALSARDAWIGWTARDRVRRLTGIVANTRFLLFPWVTTQFSPKGLVPPVLHQLDNYKTFKALTTEWVGLALAIAKERLAAEEARLKSGAQQKRTGRADSKT